MDALTPDGPLRLRPLAEGPPVAPAGKRAQRPALPASPAPSGTYLAPAAPAPRGAKAPDMLAAVLQHLRHAARAAGVGRAMEARLLEPERSLVVRFAVRMDAGHTVELDGARVLHSSTRGPGKGGIRFAPDAGPSTIRALATEMSQKTALYDLPLGGAKGGVAIDARPLSSGELARVMRGFVRALMDAERARSGGLALGPTIDSPAPDVGTSPPDVNLMDIASDELLRWLGEHGVRETGGFVVPPLPAAEDEPTGLATPHLDAYLAAFRAGEIKDLGVLATFTGKSVAKGGSEGRGPATGLGVAFAALEMLAHDGALPRGASRFEGQTVLVQGFGNVGRGAARAFAALGAKVTAIAEFDGAPYAAFRPEGFDLPTLDRLEEHLKRTGSLRGFPGLEIREVEAFWSAPADVLAPCARENELDAGRAKRTQARYVVEGANGPTTAEADKVLARRGITVIPDLFANAAGVTVSQFERVQNMSGAHWSEGQVRSSLHAHVQRAFARLVQVAGEHRCTLREAASLSAVLGLVPPR